MLTYSDILYAMGAMVLFSIVLVSANQRMVSLERRGVHSEFEYMASGVAETVTERAKVKPFDEAIAENNFNTAPDDFNACGPDGGENGQKDYDDFDDYDGWSTSMNTLFGDNTFDVSVTVVYVDSTNYESTGGTKTKWKKMTVDVTSEFLDQGNRTISFDFIKGYH